MTVIKFLEKICNYLLSQSERDLEVVKSNQLVNQALANHALQNSKFNTSLVRIIYSFMEKLTADSNVEETDEE